MKAEAEPPDLGRLLSAKQVAKLLGLHEGTIRKWARDGVFDIVCMGRPGKRQTIRIRRESVDKILNAEIPDN